jgi:predicted ATP-dependent protease
LTGEQGVLIPHQNVAHLFLSDEVSQAVEKGLFHIWPLHTIKEGIELLTGVEAGLEEPYPEGTVFALVEKRLREMEGTEVADKA